MIGLGAEYSGQLLRTNLAVARETGDSGLIGDVNSKMRSSVLCGLRSDADWIAVASANVSVSLAAIGRVLRRDVSCVNSA